MMLLLGIACCLVYADVEPIYATVLILPMPHLGCRSTHVDDKYFSVANANVYSFCTIVWIDASTARPLM